MDNHHHHHLQWENSLYMTIFNGYAKILKGTLNPSNQCWRLTRFPGGAANVLTKMLPCLQQLIALLATRPPGSPQIIYIYTSIHWLGRSSGSRGIQIPYIFPMTWEARSYLEFPNHKIDVQNQKVHVYFTRKNIDHTIWASDFQPNPSQRQV